jgi:hypothetical protein
MNSNPKNGNAGREPGAPEQKSNQEPSSSNSPAAQEFDSRAAIQTPEIYFFAVDDLDRTMFPPRTSSTSSAMIAVKESIIMAMQVMPSAVLVSTVVIICVFK